MVGDKTVYSTDNMLCAAISGSGGLWLLEADACLRFITASGEIQREISCPWIENPSQVYLRSGGDRLYVIEGQQITMQDLFVFKQTGLDSRGKVQGYFTPTGAIPTFYGDLAPRGLNLDISVFTPANQAGGATI